jgi:hypothetical protein
MRAGERRSDNSDDEIGRRMLLSLGQHDAVCACSIAVRQEAVRAAVIVRFGSLADILRCDSDVCFTPESGYVRCLRDARFGPIARHSVDDLVGAGAAAR